MRRSASSRVALLVAGAFFMENLDGTVVITALPQMAQSFGVQAVDLNIGVSAYLLTLAVLIPASGWAADRWGARTVFAWAILVFTLASVLCGLSQGLVSFTAARVLQGIGGAMMVPVGRLAVLRSTSKNELMRAIATITWPGLAAPVLGPPVGGFIATYWSWHWIFFLNVPLGVIGLVLALRMIPAGGGGHAKPFDLPGFLLTGTACLCLMYGIELAGRAQASFGLAGTCLAASLVLGVLAVRHARRRSDALVDLWALRLRSFAVTIWGGSLFRMAIGAVPFLLPLMFQLSFGLNAFEAGLLVLAVFAGNIAMKPLTGPVLRRFSFRATLLVNGLINAAAIAACALLTPDTPVPVISGLLFVSGLARSMQFTALNTLAFADVPERRMSGANTLFNIAQQMTLGLGIALGAASLRLAPLLHTGAGGEASLLDFRIAFLVVGLMALLAVVDVLGLGSRAGDEVRGSQTRPAAGLRPPSSLRPTRN